MKKKQLLCMLMALVMVVTSLPLSCVTADVTAEKESAKDKIYPYTIFASSYDEGSIVFQTGNVCVNGDIGTNGTIKCSGTLNVNGKKGEHENITAPDFWKWIENNGGGNNSTISEKDILLKEEVRYGSDDVVACYCGDITIDSENVDLNGLIYAPNGTITIKAKNLNMNSVIMVADKIVIDCSNVNANYNSTLGGVILEGKSQDGNDQKKEDGTDDKTTQKYTISFDLCGVETTEVPSQLVTKGDYAVKPDTPANDDYTFIGWYLDENLEHYYQFDEIPVTKDIVLHAGWYHDSDTTDSDGDGLRDEYEKLIGTDRYSNDTDKDGISDYDEMYYDLNTDPCKKDTNGDGISDGDEDADKDGITNIKEFELNTKPDYVDTDGDGLEDGIEVTIYGTDPVKKDTDGDGLDDDKELLYKTDPVVYNDTFDITADIKKGDTDIANISFSVSVDGLTAKQVDSLTIDPVYNKTLFPYDMPGYIGCPYDLNMSGEFEKAKLIFEYDEELNKKMDFDPIIYYFDEEEQDLMPLETTVIGNKAMAITTHFSEYVLVDRHWYEESKKWTSSKIDGYTSGKISIIMDDSGSMKTNDKDNIRLSVARKFVGNLPINAKANIYKFASSFEKICDFTNEKKKLKSYLTTNYFRSSGKTCLNTVLQAALKDFGKGNNNTLKVIVVLTDGVATDEDKLDEIIKNAKKKKVKIYSVGLECSDSWFQRDLEALSEETGGDFFYADEVDDLENIYDEISSDINLLTDSDADGLPDFYEDNLPCFNGKIIECDKNNADTDGDGLKDGEEVVIKKIYNASKKKYRIYAKLKSNPTLKDSDGDGLLDNTDIKRGNSVIAPKDNNCLKYNGTYNLWKKHIYEMEKGTVGEKYSGEGSQDQVKKEFLKLTDQYIKNKADKDAVRKIVEWATNEIEKNIRKAIINYKDNLDDFLKKHKKGIREVAMEVKKHFNNEIAAAAGAYILNFVYDDKESAYHSLPATWQKTYGYNKLFDDVFRIGSNMSVEDIHYNYNNKEYVLWMWKGDYWNLGTGSEIGLYQQSVESRTHYDAVDFLCPMQLSTYKYSNGQVYGSYYNWNPIYNKQWWITAFDWRHPKSDPKKLVTIGKIDFDEKTGMAQIVREEIKKKFKDNKIFGDIILNKNSNTIWIMWGGNE